MLHKHTVQSFGYRLAAFTMLVLPLFVNALLLAQQRWYHAMRLFAPLFLLSLRIYKLTYCPPPPILKYKIVWGSCHHCIIMTESLNRNHIG